MSDRAFEAAVRDGVLRVRRPGTTWLSSGWAGGRRTSAAAYNVSVPEGWRCDDVGAYVRDRLAAAGFETGAARAGDGTTAAPVLLTGVDMEHARGARCGPVTVYATAGISNPATLPMDPSGGTLPDGEPDFEEDAAGGAGSDANGSDAVGTVNLVVGTTRALEAGALANLLTVAAEAKTATLLAETCFSGTTTDAIVAGSDPDGPETAYSGSATPVGAATRACVREAVGAALAARYEGTDASIPDSVADADHGVSTDVRADVFRP